MKLTETINSLKIDETEVPIVLIDGSRESILLAQMLQLVRSNTPVLVCPEFWTDKQKRDIEGFVDSLGVRSYMMSAFRAKSDGHEIATEYRTNVCSLPFSQPYDESFFDRLIVFDGKTPVIPSHLWAKTFIAGPQADYFTDRSDVYPFADWTPADFEQAFTMMQTPDFGDGWPRLIKEADDGRSNAASART